MSNQLEIALRKVIQEEIRQMVNESKSPSLMDEQILSRIASLFGRGSKGAAAVADDTAKVAAKAATAGSARTAQTADDVLKIVGDDLVNVAARRGARGFSSSKATVVSQIELGVQKGLLTADDAKLLYSKVMEKGPAGAKVRKKMADALSAAHALGRSPHSGPRIFQIGDQTFFTLPGTTSFMRLNKNVAEKVVKDATGRGIGVRTMRVHNTPDLLKALKTADGATTKEALAAVAKFGTPTARAKEFLARFVRYPRNVVFRVPGIAGHWTALAIAGMLAAGLIGRATAGEIEPVLTDDDIDEDLNMSVEDLPPPPMTLPREDEDSGVGGGDEVDITDIFIREKVYDNTTDPSFKDIKYFFDKEKREVFKRRADGSHMARYFQGPQGWRADFKGRIRRLGPRTTAAMELVDGTY